MTLEEALECAKNDAETYDEPIVVLYDRLLEKHVCCGVRFMDHYYPQSLKGLWNVVELFEPKRFS